MTNRIVTFEDAEERSATMLQVAFKGSGIRGGSPKHYRRNHCQ
jgi:hypothetical protein